MKYYILRTFVKLDIKGKIVAFLATTIKIYPPFCSLIMAQ